MAKQPLHGLLDQIIDQFASAIAARAEQMIARSPVGRARLGARVRTCPFPGCNKPGAGPRNRWFCREHAKSVPVKEQKRLLAERAKQDGAALVMRGARGGANRGRKLDMSCRVEGCKNQSRGPRFGFICDEHRKKLSAKEQRDAREKWKASKAA